MNKIFTNVEKSVFTNSTIVKEVKKHYGIDIIKIEKIIGGSANLYKVYSDKVIYVLKEFQEWYNKDSILKEVHVINHLRNKNIKVPEYIKCLNGKYSFNYKEREVILQKYIDGIVKKPNTGDINDLLESAKILGQIVKSLEDYPYEDMNQYENIINALTSKDIFREAINKNNDLISKTKDKNIINDLNIKNNIAKELLMRDIPKDINKVTFKKSHGDFGIVQLIYGKEITVIDLATAMELPIVYEIIRSYAGTDKKCIDGKIDIDNLILYIKEFLKYASLNKYDLKYMTYIYMHKLASSSYGYKQYINNGNLELLRFGKWRTKICKYLFDNYEYIGQRLEEELETLL